MFGLFSKRDKQLEAIIYQIKVDLSNNYKDNAIEGIEKLAKLIDEKNIENDNTAAAKINIKDNDNI